MLSESEFIPSDIAGIADIADIADIAENIVSIKIFIII